MADPVRWLTPDSIEQLREVLNEYPSQPIAGLPPFTGGLAGMISYDHNRKLETIQPAKYDVFNVPDLAFGLYDVVVAFDHVSNESWLISQGFDAADNSRRQTIAQERFDFFHSLLRSNTTQPAESKFAPTVPLSNLAPQYPVAGLPFLTSNFSEQEYMATVQKCIDYIYAGDVFQINLAQRLLANCLLYTSPSPRDKRQSRMPSSA